MAVSDGFIFTANVFFGHEISEIPRPIAVKLCHMIRNLVCFIMQVPKFKAFTRKIWVQKHAKFGRNVISYVTIRFSMWDFLLVFHWNWSSISKRFQDIWLQSTCPMCKSSLRMHNITWPVTRVQNLDTYLFSHPYIFCSLRHFYWALMKKNKGCLLLKPQC